MIPRYGINLGENKKIDLFSLNKFVTYGEMKEMRKDRRADQIAGSGQAASPCWRYAGRFHQRKT